jgi:NitT/TauT family transport system ATP-binding protein
MDGNSSRSGPSGCGKTTFLSVVDGLIAATRAASGRRQRGDEAGAGPRGGVSGRLAAAVADVLRNVLYGLECLGVKTREAKERGAFYRDGRAVRLRASLSLRTLRRMRSA